MPVYSSPLFDFGRGRSAISGQTLFSLSWRACSTPKTWWLGGDSGSAVLRRPEHGLLAASADGLGSGTLLSIGPIRARRGQGTMRCTPSCRAGCEPAERGKSRIRRHVRVFEDLLSQHLRCGVCTARDPAKGRFPWPEGTDGCVPVRVVQAVASHLEVANADTSVGEGRADVTACGHWPPTMAAVWTRFRATNLH